ncbi:MAG: hypothetical protein ABS873_07355 [Alkalibacterium sp.]
MGRFDTPTQYILMIESDSVGEWIIDEEYDGTPEHPIHMPKLSAHSKHPFSFSDLSEYSRITGTHTC